MKNAIKRILVIALSIAVLATFTPMFSVGTASAATALKAPVTFSGTAPSAKSIQLKWSKSAGAKSYVVYRNGKKLKTVKALKFTDKKVKKGKVYKYAVAAAKGKKTSKKSYVIEVIAAKNSNATAIEISLDSNKVALGSIVQATDTIYGAYTGIDFWSSSDESVATVDEDGKIFGVALGTCAITVRAHNGISATAEIEVIDEASQVFLNGKVYTVEGDDWDTTPQQAMAIGADGKILAVGTDAEIKAFVGEKTVVTNLHGKSVYPGFIDSHVHPPGTAMTDLYEINNYFDFKIPETIDTVKAFVDENPDLAIYWGSGFNYGMFGDYIGCSTPDAEHPSPKALLDAVCNDRPIILTSNDGHSRWLNSKALEACGIDETTQATQGGNIQKLIGGEPNGILTDCSNLITLQKDYTEEMYDNGLKYFCNMMNAWGYTGANTGGQATVENAVNLDKKGELTMRINYSSNMYPECTLEENLDNLHKNQELVKDSDNVMVKTAKFFCDGVVEGYTAYMLEPYVGTAAEDMGDDWVSASKWADVDAWNENMLAVQKEGVQIHVHAIGDAAVKMTVDGIEYAQDNAGLSDYRNVITHLQVVRNTEKERMGNLGIIAALQPFWMLKEPDWYDPVDENYLGVTRAWREYPLKSLQNNGVLLTFSGDFPVSPINNPFWAIEASVTRNLNNADYYGVDDILDENDPTYLLNAKERVDLKTAIEAYTINGAYQMYEEDLCGSLKPGKVADFIILQEDPMKVDVLDLDGIKVLKTYKDGQLVYEAE
ncbi:MAG: amidohydrolase family protein [Firmicutes bacterium]|nr:amidohydrolase family protein [Bacillota bacterium]